MNAYDRGRAVRRLEARQSVAQSNGTILPLIIAIAVLTTPNSWEIAIWPSEVQLQEHQITYFANLLLSWWSCWNESTEINSNRIWFAKALEIWDPEFFSIKSINLALYNWPKIAAYM